MEKTLKLDQSDFEIGPLPSGRYLLGAYVVIKIGTPQRYSLANEFWTYFPGVTDVNLAEPIEVVEGKPSAHINLKMAY